MLGEEEDPRLLPSIIEPKINLAPPSTLESFTRIPISYNHAHHVQKLECTYSQCKSTIEKHCDTLPKIQQRNSKFPFDMFNTC
jgi:hypothetical protein